MHFTRLRLNGFKSFVDPTELAIAPGLTGVVGPNGCGKSNLLEALRWVMGEHRASAVRGAGMEDVIFAGTASRPARHFAEVSLRIEDAGHLLPASLVSAVLVPPEPASAPAEPVPSAPDRRARAGAGADDGALEITRRITRDLGSAYRVNQKEVRARDVQMLFADASTGATSPALVRQGQIAELVNARPRARRLILEEAAGISGLYARRHEAELRLAATEQNLLRVDDLLGQLAAQLTSLQRQVRQAVRYRELGAQLRAAEGMLLWRRWHEAAEVAAAAEAELAQLLTAAAQAERAARAATAAREGAEAALPPLNEEQAIARALAQRLQVEAQALAGQQAQAEAAISTLEAQRAQLARDHGREEALNRDAGDSLARLQAEAAELTAAAADHAPRLTELAAVAAAAAEALEGQQAAQQARDEELARLSARHHAAARLIEDSDKALSRSRQDAERAAQEQAQARRALAEGEAALTGLQNAAQQAQAAADEAEAALAAADTARSEVQALEAEARAVRAEAEGELAALSAEGAALARLLARNAGAEGQVLDLLQVAPGVEQAVGAALGDDLRAPLLGPGRRSGWALLPDLAIPPPLPEGAEPLLAHVQGPPELARRLAQVGLVADAAQGARLQARLAPGQRLVSAAGDLWRWDGFCAAAADAPSAEALRLAQVNRGEAVKQQLATAQARADGVCGAHEQLKTRLAAAHEAERQAREARRLAERGLGEALRRLSQAEAGRNIAAGRLESHKLALARYHEELQAAEVQLAQARAQAEALPPLGALQQQVAQGRAALEEARSAWMEARSAHDEWQRAGELRARRQQTVAQELAGWEARLQSAGGRLDELARRDAEAAEALQQARTRLPELQAQAGTLAERQAQIAQRCEAAAEALAAGESARHQAADHERAAARAAGEAREARARAEAHAEAARAALSAAVAAIREQRDASPEELRVQLGAGGQGGSAPPEAGAAVTGPDRASPPPAEALEAEVQRLRRAREALGAVNLRAEEDAREAATEHEKLAADKADLEGAVAQLRAGISALNREGRERLLTAFEQVNGNFGALYQRLFGGGEARLQLVESDDPLQAGLEILCQPPGKKLSVLSLLSGGEQTLTALALIFAVFQANPAPICVLDEVDAPLDDANVSRFCDLMDEMTRQTETRFLVITHHSVTMARMDRLYGVTMGERGVSQLVSVDLGGAEALVA